MDMPRARKKMVETQLIPRGITDERVISAMMKVPRHKFVEEAMAAQAYGDYPLPIGYGQTISQPYIVAEMTQALGLKGHERVLEIGTGSGYQTAILAELCDRVYSIERIKPLLLRARNIIDDLRYFNVALKAFDGTLGWSDEAPFDHIIITAGAPSIPSPLIKQLKDNGIMVIPVGSQNEQELLKITKADNSFTKESLGLCRFVKLIGQNAWEE